jgi:prepilin peptidase CpaA
MFQQLLIRWLPVVAVVGLTATALATDLKWRRIPNKLTVPAFLAAVVFYTAAYGQRGLWFSLAGFLLGFGMLLVLWLLGGGGGGDVKLMGALGAWLGWQKTLYVLIGSTVLVAVGSIVFIFIEWFVGGLSFVKGGSAARGRSQGRRGQKDPARKWRARRQIMPYALPVALATWGLVGWELTKQMLAR